MIALTVQRHDQHLADTADGNNMSKSTVHRQHNKLTAPLATGRAPVEHRFAHPKN
ncbi:hypothetical protein ABT404_18950 [Streptomyces hyaluromycini]|uniref:Transposase n=1 Tax=Streptomyces hyaluromycini TaxID=1377993 RepID=A0ABV1WXP6_9ACTN